MAGIELANWNWKVVHRFVSERFDVSLHRVLFPGCRWGVLLGVGASNN